MQCSDKPPCHDLLEVRGYIAAAKQPNLSIEQQLLIITKCANQHCPHFNLNRLRATKISPTADFNKQLETDLDDFLKACDCAHR